MPSLTYRETVHTLEGLGVMPDRPPGLKAVQAGLKLLFAHDLPRERIIVVAGTNGKGSTCATLEALFLEAGETVGLFISPHLIESTERIRLNGQDVSPELFCAAYRAVQESLRPHPDLKLSHFEMLTLMAAWVFFSPDRPAEERPRWVIFEVGLGGTWDATNAIPHDHCVITSLSYDHQNLLGNTLPEIAANKLGILGPETQTLVHAPFPSEVLALAQDTRAHLLKQNPTAQWIESLPYPYDVQQDPSSREPLFVLQTPWGPAPLSLPGSRAAQNTSVALTLFRALGFEPGNFLAALRKVRWPGRMQRLSLLPTRCPVYLSGDHNPDGVRSLLEILPHYPRQHLFILVGVGRDKDLDGILTPLAQLPHSSLFLTQTPFRGRSLAEYGEWRSRAQGAWTDPREALQVLLAQATPLDCILVTGSLYLVGEIQKPG